MSVNIDKVTLMVQCRCCGRVCLGSWLGRPIEHAELTARTLMGHTLTKNYCSKHCYDTHCAAGTLPKIVHHAGYCQLYISGEEHCIRCLHRLHKLFAGSRRDGEVIFNIVTDYC